MIYFEEKTKRLVQDMFHLSIASDATLVLGGTDVLYSPERFQRQQGSGGAWYIKH
jgi:chemotaxis methyl-accepting protein methylase